MGSRKKPVRRSRKVTVAWLFRMTRKGVRMTQYEFSLELMVSQAKLSKIESGLMQPSWEQLLGAFHIVNEAASQYTSRRLFDLWQPIIDLPRYRSASKTTAWESRRK